MTEILPKIVLMIIGTLLYAIHAFERNEYFNISAVVPERLRSYQPTSFKVLALAVLLDIPQSAHECNKGQRIFSAEANIHFTFPFSSLSKAHLVRREKSFKFQLQTIGGAPQDFLMLKNVNITDKKFKQEGEVHSLYLRYMGEIGKYPELGLVQAGCSGGKSKQSPIVTYYDNEDQIGTATSIIPIVSFEKDDYLLTVGIKKRGMRRVIFSPITPSSISSESETVIQRTYKASVLKHEILFAIGDFKYEASSAVSDALVGEEFNTLHWLHNQ